jgi:hypothetical protein
VTSSLPSRFHSRLRWPSLFILPIILLGYQPMASSTEDFRLSWQWNRPINHAVLIRVTKIKAEGKGLFGIKSSPSVAGALPDAQELTGTVIAGRDNPVGTHLMLRIPKHELPDLQPPYDAVIGYTDDHAAIKIESVRDNIAPGQHIEWLNHWLDRVRAQPS